MVSSILIEKKASKLSNYGDFLFKRYAFDTTSGNLSLLYKYAEGPQFEEKLAFPPPFRALSPAETAALDRAFRLIFLLSGVSYYKSYIPKTLRCEAFALSHSMASFIEKTYRNGLAEFAYKNNIVVEPHVAATAIDIPSPISLALPRRSLTPIGGGKDSVVTVECLRKAEESQTLFVVAGGGIVAAPIRETISYAKLPSIAVKRIISPTLLELNKKDALNGHVPITAIVSSIAVATAILYGFDTIIFSNEQSASAPNVRLGNLEINHQYSKSLSFEVDFANVIHAHISPDINYFSLLRPLTEAEIARRFAKLEGYHPVFRSCNTAFRQEEKERGKTWCCACPKCRFVFLALAPFLDKEKLTQIFGANLLADPFQLEGYRELCGLSAHKPFECVGEIEESALLMSGLSRFKAWKDAPIVKLLAPSLPFDEQKFNALFANRTAHAVPEKYLGMLNACR